MRALGTQGRIRCEEAVAYGSMWEVRNHGSSKSTVDTGTQSRQGPRAKTGAAGVSVCEGSTIHRVNAREAGMSV